MSSITYIIQKIGAKKDGYGQATLYDKSGPYRLADFEYQEKWGLMNIVFFGDL